MAQASPSMTYPRPLDQEMSRTPEQAAARADAVTNAFFALGLNWPPEKNFPHSGIGLDQYVRTCGAGRYFASHEYTRPHSPAKARRVGYAEFVPPQFVWPWVALVVRLGDLMRVASHTPVKLRNLWRPMSYNRLVAKSAIYSDHPNACGGDFYFGTTSACRRAEGLIRGLNDLHPQLELSVGFGARNLHVGALSPKGARSWKYKSYKGPKL